MTNARQPGRFARLAHVAQHATVSTVQAVFAPHKASLARLADIPLTVAGGACFDFAAFHWAHSWGWLVTGLSLVVLEHLIADDDSTGAI